MLERFDESELLALIENGLDPKAASALRKRLAEDPQAPELIERMRSDRAHLRSAPEPVPPADLLAELEPMLARPMLMPETDWRRKLRRSRRPAPALVAAAVVALALLAGVWAVASGLLSFGGSGPSTPAPALAAGSGSGPGPQGASRRAPLGDVIHPDAPMTPAPSVEMAVADAGGADEEAPTPRSAGFVLVVSAEDPSSVEATLHRAVGGLGERIALVRNFSWEEVDRLQWEMLAGDQRPIETRDLAEAMAGTPPPRDGLALRPRRSPNGLGPQKRSDDRARSAQLRGPRDLAPTLERQLEFSEWGAAYTISVPAGRLAELLARVGVDEGRHTELRIPRLDAADAPEARRWLRDYDEIQQTMALLRRGGDDVVILLPVVVEERD